MSVDEKPPLFDMFRGENHGEARNSRQRDRRIPTAVVDIS